MGVGTDPVTAAPTPAGRGRRLLDRFDAPAALVRLTIASIVVNVLIVVTGGAVRLTNSGLGCPTWPRCTDSSLVPTRKYHLHGIIEFTNRQLTFLIGVVALLTLVAAWRQRRHVTLAVVAFLGIPAQAILGGITVLTDLNPYAVACHLLLSMLVLAAYALLLWRVTNSTRDPVPAAALWLVRVLALAAAVVLAFGTVVTGSGPHAGDVKAGTLHRIHLPVSSATQLHADAVWVLVGLTVGAIALAFATGASRRVRQAAVVLFGIELAQGVIGYTQYFLHVPPLLVGLHMFGACLVWLGVLRLLLLVETHTFRTVG